MTLGIGCLDKPDVFDPCVPIPGSNGSAINQVGIRPCGWLDGDLNSTEAGKPDRKGTDGSQTLRWREMDSDSRWKSDLRKTAAFGASPSTQ
jgi:hypothetical protein